MVKITLKINGMMCGMCEPQINDAIRRDFVVKKVWIMVKALKAAD